MDRSLSVVYLNIEKDRHLGRWPRLIRELDPDVVFLQEMLGSRLEWMKSFFGHEIRYAPMGISRSGEMGIAMLAKRALFVEYGEYYYRKDRSGKLPVLDRDNNFCINRAIQHARVVKDGAEYHVGHTHFSWTPDGYPDAIQWLDVGKVVSFLVKHPMIFGGDLNAPRISEDGRPGPIWRSFLEYADKSTGYRDNVPLNVASTLDPALHRAKDLKLVVDALFTPKGYEARNVRLTEGLSDHKMISAEIVRVA